MTINTVAYFNRTASVYEDTDADQSIKMAELYQRLLAKNDIEIPAGNMLDVGIATGLLSAAFAGDDLSIHGIDGAQNMLNICFKEGKDIDAENLICIDLTESDIPFESNSFSFTITSSTLNYLKNACEVIREMIAVTEPGGIIIIDPELHNAPTDLPFSNPHDKKRPPFFIQSEQMLQQIFAESGVIILTQVSYPPQEMETLEYGKFQVSQRVFILQKNGSPAP